MATPERDLDLSAIDALTKTQGPGSLMDRVVAQLDDTQRATLDAACGLTYEEEHKRQYAAIARWLNDVADTNGRVTGDKVSDWAGKQ